MNAAYQNASPIGAGIVGRGLTATAVSEPSRPRVVPGSMARLSNASERYRNILDELEKRLSPVLMAVPADPKGQEQPKPHCGVELGDAIDGQTSFIDTNSDRLQSLLERLEV